MGYSGEGKAPKGLLGGRGVNGNGRGGRGATGTGSPRLPGQRGRRGWGNKGVTGAVSASHAEWERAGRSGAGWGGGRAWGRPLPTHHQARGREQRWLKAAAECRRAPRSAEARETKRQRRRRGRGGGARGRQLRCVESGRCRAPPDLHCMFWGVCRVCVRRGETHTMLALGQA